MSSSKLVDEKDAADNDDDNDDDENDPVYVEDDEDYGDDLDSKSIKTFLGKHNNDDMNDD